MTAIRESLQGVKIFGRTNNIHQGQSNPLRELMWLSKRAVQEDKILHKDHPHQGVNLVKMYYERLKEIGFIFAEMFVFQEYAWQPQSESPRIIDLGGDVGGFSALYWKSISPNSRVTIVEANPSTAKVMADSFKRKGLNDIEVINSAVSENEGSIELNLSNYNPNCFTGQRTHNFKESSRPVIVPAIKLSNIVGNEEVDLLKIDIEGSEGPVIRELALSGKINQIKEIIMEFHSDPTNPQNSLDEILALLKSAGFNILNPHVSGRTRKLKQEPIDLSSIQPTDRMFIAFLARRDKTIT